MNTPYTPKRLRDLGIGRSDAVMLAPTNIAIEKGHNPRDYNLPENRAHLNALKLSIRAIGVQIPLLVRWDVNAKQAVLVDGECRLRACLELIEEGVEIKAIKCVQVQGHNAQDRLLTALVSNTGKPLSQWELGGGFRRLTSFGWVADDIAKKTGYTGAFVNQCIELSDAPDDVKHLLSSEAVTPSLALKHLRENGENASKTLKDAVNDAKGKKPGKNGKTTAKRAYKKQEGVRLVGDAFDTVVEALKLGRKSDDPQIAEACADAIEEIDTNMAK